MVPFPADGVLKVRATWPPATVLRVVGEDTRADLPGIDLAVPFEPDKPIEPETFNRMSMAHPGIVPETRLAKRGISSPIPFPVVERKAESFRPWQETYWARAPGYAWGRIEIDIRSGGEKLLVLPRAAAAEVRITNFRPGSKEVLRARPAGRKEATPEAAAGNREAEDRNRPFFEVDVEAGGPLRIDAIPPGRYVFSVEVGIYFRDPEVLGSSEVELRAGETTRVSIDLRRGAPATPK